jgi:hypothetical protein
MSMANDPNKQNRKRRGGGLVFKAFLFSLMLNSVMSISGYLGNSAKPLAFLGYLAQAIGAPTALLIGRLIKPSGKSLVGIAVAGVEGLVCNIVLLTLLTWLALVLLERRHAARQESEEQR